MIILHSSAFRCTGSLLDIIKYSFPGGFDEIVVATVLKQVLDGLTYLVQNGWIHRDIKAANLLCDDDGTVLLADFGVSSSLPQEVPLPNEVDKDGIPIRKLGSRKSFVGKPSPIPMLHYDSRICHCQVRLVGWRQKLCSERRMIIEVWFGHTRTSRETTQFDTFTSGYLVVGNHGARAVVRKSS